MKGLSKQEIALINKIGDCCGDYSKLRHADRLLGASYKKLSKKKRRKFSKICSGNDVTEFVALAHGMQRQVMARAAQRDHPKHFPRRPR